jgi:hypothetical protein
MFVPIAVHNKLIDTFYPNFDSIVTIKNTTIRTYKKGTDDHLTITACDMYGELQTTYEYFNKEGKRHRNQDKPALVTNFANIWFDNGIVHRDQDKPAFVTSRCNAWFYKGMLCRLYKNRPALIEFELKGDMFSPIPFKSEYFSVSWIINVYILHSHDGCLVSNDRTYHTKLFIIPKEITVKDMMYIKPDRHDRVLYDRYSLSLPHEIAMMYRCFCNNMSYIGHTPRIGTVYKTVNIEREVPEDSIDDDQESGCGCCCDYQYRPSKVQYISHTSLLDQAVEQP